MQLSQKHWKNFNNSLVINIENYSIPRRHRLLGQATKQPLSSFEPQKS